MKDALRTLSLPFSPCYDSATMKTAIPLLATLLFILPQSASALTLDSLGGDCETAGIWDASSLTCTLTEDFSGSVSITADSITLDGAGHTITGTGSGITASGRNFLTVKNLTLAGFGTGMKFSLVGHSTISGNTIRTGENGIGLSLSVNASSNTIQDNIIEGPGNAGIFSSDANFNVFRRNTIRNFKSGLLFTYCSGSNTFRENTIEGNGIGADFAGSWGTFTRNNFKGNGVDFHNGFTTCGNGIETLSKPLPEGGNYWSKNTACRDENGDHLCDAPYAAATTTDNSTNLVTPLVDHFPWAMENGWNLPTTTPPNLSNPAEIEDDNNQDAKGVADKTNFTFSISYAGSVDPSDVTLWTNDGAVTSHYPLSPRTTLREYSMTSTFPKGRYTYHFESNGGAQRFPETGELLFTTGYSNVAFLPGLEASRLYRPTADPSVTKVRLWEPPLLLQDNTQLFLNPDGTPKRNDIFTEDVVDEALGANIYESFIDSMDTLAANKTIHAWKPFPYDWRYDVRDIVDRPIALENSSYSMTEEIRKLAETSDTGKVTIVAHSNGGLIAKALSDTLGTDSPKLLDQMIFVASPQAGTPQAAGAILHGYDQGIPKDWLPLLITPKEARDLAVNMPSAYGLLPSELYFSSVDDPVISFDDAPLLAGWRARYGIEIHSAERLHNFLADQTREAMPVTEETKNPIIGNETLLTGAEVLHNTLDNWTPPEGVTLTQIAGWGEETLKSIVYYQGVKTTCAIPGDYSTCTGSPALEYKPKMVLDGDGTVVVPSALWTGGTERYFVDLDDYNIPLIRHIKHADILEVQELRDFIKNIITRNNSALPTFIKTSSPVGDASKRLHFTLHSPLTLDLYDSAGNHTGISTATGALEENIPGTRYRTFGEVKYISAPASTTLRLVMNGYATGSFTLDMEEVSGDTVTASTTFAGIPSMTGTVASITLPDGTLASSSSLAVDENGDGITDLSLLPKIGGIVTLPIFYRFDGFLQPVNDTAYHPEQSPSVFKGGSTIPVKFQIKNGDGISVQSNTLPIFSFQKLGNMSASVDEFTYSDPASTGSTFRWDSASQQYIYNWSTKGITSGSWYQISAKLDDGTVHSVTVGLR